MRLLLTADWQADFEVLDLCEQAAQEVLQICRDEHLDGFVVAGDLKRQYNPIDTRVASFWMGFISLAVEQELKVVLVLGNHDRVGMYSEAQNWLPILRHAGAVVVHNKPKRVTMGSATLYCLPYSSSVETTRRWATNLAESVPSDETSSVLIFHNDLKGATYNVLGHESGARLSVNDLKPRSYDWCLGGHIHLRQKVGSEVYYIGNPFCSDWGECNQPKGYAILKRNELNWKMSAIPGWYDPSWPNFPRGKEDWKGCRVRIHVPIEVGQSYSLVLDKARVEAEKKYAGATIYTVPEFKESQAAEIKVKLSDPDAVKIRTYVDETLPPELNRHRKAIIAYLLYKLRRASEGLGLRAGGKIQFLHAEARRFLSFFWLDVDYRQPGLRLITGKNKDWMGRSNGSGKTNYQSPIPVALFGKTFKDQKHDAWAYDKSKKAAWVRLKFRDAKGRVILVERVRRPGRLQLFVDGKDQSSGLQSTAQAGTQGLIEKLSGFSWQTLANAVYIDQQQVNTFLSGTPAEQKRILERFQNLERFAKALEQIVKDYHLKTVAYDDAHHEQGVVQARLSAYRETLAREPADGIYASALKHLRAAALRLETARDKRDLSPEVSRWEERTEKLIKREHALQKYMNSLEGKRLYAANRLGAINKAMGEDICPTCLQEVDKKRLQKVYAEDEMHLNQIIKKIKTEREDLTALNEEITTARANAYNLTELQGHYETEVRNAETECKTWRQAVKSAREYEEQTQGRRKAFLMKIRSAKRDLRFWERQKEIISEEQAITHYCMTAFSRNGVPAFLNAQICPILNKAAEYYAEVFTGKEIQVRFKMKDAEFEVEVVNAHGGKGIGDQSTGEKKMAAIIASFALRAIAPPCNLLVLDEPGDGLDAGNAKAFAAGLRRLKDSLGTVLLTTHNPIIAGELSGETCVNVEKSGGVSRVV